VLFAARDTTVRAVVAFGAAAASWDSSPRLRRRLLAAVDRLTSPVLLVHAANDFSVAPGKALAAELNRLGKVNQLAIYPRAGRSADDGHDFVYSSPAAWEATVFAFLDRSLARRR